MPAAETSKELPSQSRSRSWQSRLYGHLWDLSRGRGLDKDFTAVRPGANETGEAEILTRFNDWCVTHGGNLTVRVGSSVLTGVEGMVKVPGTPKADVALVTYDKALRKFVSVYYISHKKGRNATDFQQYSGVSEKAGRRIADHPEVRDFLKALEPHAKELSEASAGDRVRYYREIKDEALLRAAVYGPDLRPGINLVDAVAQGDIVLTGGPRLTTLSFRTKFHSVNDLAWLKHGPYQAVLLARYGTAEDTFTVPGTSRKYRNIRAVIYPSLLKGAKAVAI